jgi:CDP-paratose 2-epimerase
MRILVTGACGFLGSHVCELFSKLGWEVAGLDNLTTYEFERSGYKHVTPRRYNLEYLRKLGVDVIVGDVTDWKVVSGLECDYIAHTAAQPTMTLSIEDPRRDFETNVVGTYNVLELAKKLSIPVVISSTVHVYGNAINQKLVELETRFHNEENPAISEEHPTLCGDISPLHASKRAGEIYGQSYIDTYRVRAGIFRLTGMYGPRQFAGKHHGWVSNFIIRTLLRLPITVYGTDKQVRDILYADDAAEAFLKFWEHQIPGIYNIGGGLSTSISLREVLDLIEQIAQVKQERRIASPRFGDLYYFVADNTKAKEKMGWYPRTVPEIGLRRTVDWIKENMELFEGIT